MKSIIAAITLLASLTAFADKDVCVNFTDLNKRPPQIELNNGNFTDEYFGPMTISLSDVRKFEHRISQHDEDADGRPGFRITTIYSRKLKYLGKDGSTGIIHLGFSRNGLIGAKNLDVQIDKMARSSTNGSRALVSSPEIELEVSLGRCH